MLITTMRNNSTARRDRNKERFVTKLKRRKRVCLIFKETSFPPQKKRQK